MFQLVLGSEPTALCVCTVHGSGWNLLLEHLRGLASLGRGHMRTSAMAMAHHHIPEVFQTGCRLFSTGTQSRVYEVLSWDSLACLDKESTAHSL